MIGIKKVSLLFILSHKWSHQYKTFGQSVIQHSYFRQFILTQFSFNKLRLDLLILILTCLQNQQKTDGIFSARFYKHLCRWFSAITESFFVGCSFEFFLRFLILLPVRKCKKLEVLFLSIHSLQLLLHVPTFSGSGREATTFSGIRFHFLNV